MTPRTMSCAHCGEEVWFAFTCCECGEIVCAACGTFVENGTVESSIPFRCFGCTDLSIDEFGVPRCSR